jgi:hypothetical protein
MEGLNVVTAPPSLASTSSAEYGISAQRNRRADTVIGRKSSLSSDASSVSRSRGGSSVTLADVAVKGAAAAAAAFASSGAGDASILMARSSGGDSPLRKKKSLSMMLRRSASAARLVAGRPASVPSPRATRAVDAASLAGGRRVASMRLDRGSGAASTVAGAQPTARARAPTLGPLDAALKFKRLLEGGAARRGDRARRWAQLAQTHGLPGLDVRQELSVLQERGHITEAQRKRLSTRLAEDERDAPGAVLRNFLPPLRPEMTRAETRRAVRQRLLAAVGRLRGQAQLGDGWRFHAVDTERDGGSNAVDAVLSVGADLSRLRAQLSDLASKVDEASFVTVSVPRGVLPGGSFRVASDGREFVVPLPEGMRPGQALQVRVPGDGRCVVGSVELGMELVSGLRKRSVYSAFGGRADYALEARLWGETATVRTPGAERDDHSGRTTVTWMHDASLELRSDPRRPMRLAGAGLTFLLRRKTLFSEKLVARGTLRFSDGRGSTGLARTRTGRRVKAGGCALVNGSEHTLEVVLFDPGEAGSGGDGGGDGGPRDPARTGTTEVARARVRVRLLYNLLEHAMPCAVVERCPADADVIPGIEFFGFPMTMQLAMVAVGSALPRPGRTGAETHSFVCTDSDRRYHYGHCATFWRPARMRLLRIIGPMLPLDALRRAGMCVLEEVCVLACSAQPLHRTRRRLLDLVDRADFRPHAAVFQAPPVPSPRSSVTAAALRRPPPPPPRGGAQGLAEDPLAFGADAPLVEGGVHDDRLVGARGLADVHAALAVPVESPALALPAFAEDVTPAHLPPTDAKIRELVSTYGVGPHVVVWLWACLLAQRSIVVRATSYARIADVTEAVMALLWPFEWNGVYIPVLPLTEEFLGILRSPVPMLVGVVALPDEELELDDHVVVVDLDRNTVLPLPEPPWRLPADTCSRLLGAVCGLGDALRAKRPPPPPPPPGSPGARSAARAKAGHRNAAIGGNSREIRNSSEKGKEGAETARVPAEPERGTEAGRLVRAMRLQFAREIARMLENFSKYIVPTPPASADDPFGDGADLMDLGLGSSFDARAFLAQFGGEEEKDHVDFVTEFAESQLFAGFLSDYVACTDALRKAEKRRRKSSVDGAPGAGGRKGLDLELPSVGGRMAHLQIFARLCVSSRMANIGRALFKKATNIAVAVA